MKTDLTPIDAPSIKSRPVYAPLEPRAGKLHVIVADDAGADAVADMLVKANNRSEMLSAIHVMYCPGPTGTDGSAKLEALGAAQFFRAPTIPALMPRLVRVLSDAHMGTQFYLAGTESLIGQAEREIMNTGFPFASIQKEQRGSTLRRVQCVHCKGITENVATDPFKCSHCGLSLFVRDHYSRRMAAFQGVNIDAEDPGLVPESVVRFK
ncbi:dimethylamine monooxygenase subunit DmmA family protein [Tabrizicola sp.]|uniref:dimethylamine monooxygenase subunit DmmA family protein n=1 Tax=Tabrizicola sp. TaxID=2005166 RepID=UPI0027367604|nr:dimethylamine monooxygenase subunit DmmA family protein [Tabrizicola sp.]MDP3197596.1 dimethylamine monooxygenase subunit DmmA family protein [Tabrizicola sp.]